MKQLIQTFLLIFLFQISAYSGESGDMPEQEENPTVEVIFDEPEEVIAEKQEDVIVEEPEKLDVSEVGELLEPKDTKVELPKNRLVEIFDQLLLTEINTKKINVVGECQKNLEAGKCHIVEPSKKSRHFNNYYFYTNEQNLVFSIIAFNDKKQSDLNLCKDKVSSWKTFFENYDLTIKNPKENSLGFILTDAPQQNSLEVFTSCYSENYRDIKSSFSIKLYKNS